MTRSISPEPAFLSPLTPDWTIRDLLEWIGMDDARCHDERLAPVLATLVGASAGPTVVRTTAPSTVVGMSAPSTVALVRALAVRVAAEPACGARRLGDAIAPALPLATPTPMPTTPHEVERGGILVAV